MSRPRVTPFEQLVTFATSAPVTEVEQLLVTVRAILKGRNSTGDAAPRKKRAAKAQESLPLTGGGA